MVSADGDYCCYAREDAEVIGDAITMLEVCRRTRERRETSK